MKPGTCCIISLIYIKPQQDVQQHQVGVRLYYIFNLHQTTTDRSGRVKASTLYYIFNLHQTTTPVKLLFGSVLLYYIFNLHQTTTLFRTYLLCLCCIISLIYIKPQHIVTNTEVGYSCIISLIYIKPQRESAVPSSRSSCIISLIYIKPQHCSTISRSAITLYYIFNLHQTTTVLLDQFYWTNVVLYL